MLLIDIIELKKREKYINCIKHPTEPLLLWSYNKECQHDRYWDEYTMLCRGLITDLDGNVLYKPFSKFFELNQHEYTMLENLPKLPYTLTEKVDGSLCILYFINEIPYMATKGSFKSDQAIEATKLIQSTGLTKKDFAEGYTYLFEYVAPDNRIVIEYKEKELRLLAAINNETEEELDLISEATRLNFKHAEIYDITIETLTDPEFLNNFNNQEGYVIRYENGLRVKVKFDEYKRLHKLISNINNKDTIISYVERAYIENDDLENLRKELPEYLVSSVMKQIHDLLDLCEEIQIKCTIAKFSIHDINTRKKQAEYILRFYKDISGLLFADLDSKLNPYRIFEHVKKLYLNGKI